MKLADIGQHKPGSRGDYRSKEFVEFYKKLRSGTFPASIRPLATDLEAFMKKYQLDGIEFGRWVNFNDRVAYMQIVNISFFDLNKILGFKDNLGFDKLIFSIGARGKSAALAHFEPTNNVINITRFKRLKNGNFDLSLKMLFIESTGGISSIAHEYGHFLDYFFGMYIDQDKDNAALSNGNSTAYHPIQEIKGPLRAQMEKVLNTIIWKQEPTTNEPTGTLTPYYEEIKRHTANTKEYWKRRNEIFARAFEVYIYEKLRAKKILNKGLTHSSNYYSAWPYIPRSERPAMIAEMDKLIKMFRSIVVDGLDLSEL